ncbi:MAG TPA: tetratricopeptide repeat protein, partial [Woeseiaceae bacterium]|nr:tetratricopeptide repeat protein [Woeseiaceae bacterium]
MPAIVLMLLGTLLVGACGLGMSTEDRLQRAEQSLQSGENRAAIIDAKNVLVDEPENVRARLLLGKAALADGDGATAEKELRRAAELGAAQEDTIAGIARALLLQRKFDALVKEFEAELPSGDADRVALLTILGDARLALKQPELAREHYSRALELDANNPAAKLGTVQSYIAEGNPLQARATLSQVLDTNSDFAAAWLTSARLNMSSGNYAAGKKDFARAETIASGNGDTDQRVRAIYGLAEASFATNELDEARKYSAQLDAIAGNSIAALQIAARLAYAEKDWNAAQEKLADILRRSPGDNAARVLLGAVHLQSGNLGQAEMYLSAAVADAPGNADARRLLAETRLQLNKSDEAQQALRPLVDTPDADPRSLAMAARVDMLSGNYAGAADFLERSVAENPATSGAELDLAIAYLLADRIEDAQRVLDAGSADDSPDAAFRRDALRVLTVSRKSGMDAAVDEGRALRDKWSSQPMAHVLFGSMLASTGRFDEARDALNAALAIAPDN